jgi:[ribosomal protein S5]-alanine N-acetyltransferase
MLPLDCGPCVLRPWRRGDEASLVTHANNIQVWRNLRDAFPHPYSRRDAEGWIAFASGVTPATNVAITIDDAVVGSVGVQMHEDVERVSAEIGYWVSEAHWGRGVATAALRGMTEYAFATFPLTRIYALPFRRNAASIRVLEKAGYEREGVLRRSAIKEGEILDQVVFAIVR